MGQTLTAERLRALLRYDPETGQFWWRRSAPGRSVKRPAGGVGYGYRAVTIDGTGYRAHRLACLYMTGAWPKDEIDHRDLDKANNAWGNLREATRSQNKANSAAYSTNTSGLKGVFYNPRPGLTKRWRARIKYQGVRYDLGHFATKEAAKVAYDRAAAEMFGEFARAA